MAKIDNEKDSSPLVSSFYSCVYVFGFSNEMLYYKNGNLREVDVSNCIKVTEDAVFQYLSEDDSQVIDVSAYKAKTDRPQLTVILSPYDDIPSFDNVRLSLIEQRVFNNGKPVWG